MNWYEIRAAQRRSAEFPGTFSVSNKTILRGSQEVAVCSDPAMAQHLAEVHNLFPYTTNALFIMRQRLKDRENTDGKKPTPY